MLVVATVVVATEEVVATVEVVATDVVGLTDEVVVVGTDDVVVTTDVVVTGAETVTEKLVFAVALLSFTVTVIVALPDCPDAGVTVTVRLLPDPPKTMLASGTKVLLDEDPVTVKLPAAVSTSLTVKAMALVAVLAAVVWLIIEEMVGKLFLLDFVIVNLPIECLNMVSASSNSILPFGLSKGATSASRFSGNWPLDIFHAASASTGSILPSGDNATSPGIAMTQLDQPRSRNNPAVKIIFSLIYLSPRAFKCHLKRCGVHKTVLVAMLKFRPIAQSIYQNIIQNTLKRQGNATF